MTPVSVVPPDPEDTSVFDNLVRISADWSALVLRDGAAFVGRAPDSGSESDFYGRAEILVRTIYTDVFSLCQLQRRIFHEFSNQLSAIPDDDAVSARTLEKSERSFMKLRRQLWLQNITVTGVSNQLLQRAQEQQRLPVLINRSLADLGDSARLLEARSARRLNASLAALTVIGLPLTLSLAAGQIVASGRWDLLLWSSGLGLLLSFCLLLWRPAREIFTPLRRRT